MIFTIIFYLRCLVLLLLLCPVVGTTVITFGGGGGIPPGIGTTPGAATPGVSGGSIDVAERVAGFVGIVVKI